MKSFVKWAGGKRRAVPRLLEFLPSKINNYFEPFVGGGALFWEVNRLKKANKFFLNDSNKRLINIYQVLKYNVDGLIGALIVLDSEYKKNPERTFYEVRDAFNKNPASMVDCAAQFIFLNRTCFNGLYRENKKGCFNVPWGKYSNPNIIQRDLLLECSASMFDVQSLNLDFEYVTRLANPGDLVYFDPPYIKIKDDSFVNYTNDGFGVEDHIRLAECFKTLINGGVSVLLSNSDTTLTRKLYSGFETHELKMARNINSNGNGRGKVSELLILGNRSNP